MSKELKPCPFCGNYYVGLRKFPLINRIGIYCDVCGNVSFFGDEHEDGECTDVEVITEHWNRRA